MLLSRKQRIILLAAGSVALLLLIGLIALAHHTSRTAAVPPSPTPTPTVTPTLTPAPTPYRTQHPTATPLYRLPLVPFMEDADPSEEPSAFSDGVAASPVPIETPSETEPQAQGLPFAVPVMSSAHDGTVRQGRFESAVRDFAAIGREDGEARVILLARLAPPTLSVLAIPCESLIGGIPASLALAGDGEDFAAEGARIRETLGAWLGFAPACAMTLDLACAEDLLNAIGQVKGGGMTFDAASFSTLKNESGLRLAYGMAALGVGTAEAISNASPLTLLSLKKLTKGMSHADRNTFELLGMLSALRRVERTAIYVLPTEDEKTGMTARRAEVQTVLATVFP